MKKAVIILLCVLFVFSINGCGTDSKAEQEKAELEKRAEAKDLTTIDTVASALAMAIANAKEEEVPVTGSFDVRSCGPDSSDPIKKGVYESLGDCSHITLVSEAAKNATGVICKYNINEQSLQVIAEGAEDCKYFEDDKGNPRKLSIEK